MAGLFCGILFVLVIISLPCKGKITEPPDGQELRCESGQSCQIKWRFDDHVSNITDGFLRFKASNTSRYILLANTDDFRTWKKHKDNSLSFNILVPSSLTLINVNQSYDGCYTFGFSPKDNVTVEYSSSVKVSVVPKASSSPTPSNPTTCSVTSTNQDRKNSTTRVPKATSSPTPSNPTTSSVKSTTQDQKNSTTREVCSSDGNHSGGFTMGILIGVCLAWILF